MITTPYIENFPFDNGYFNYHPELENEDNLHAISQCHPTASFIFIIQTERALRAEITHCSLSMMQQQRLPSTCAHSIWA